MELVVHPLEPIYDDRSGVLILGTMPSPISRRERFYYANPTNRFWPVLSAVLGEEDPRTSEGRRALLLRRGVALWDVLFSCRIEGAADSEIRDPVPNAIAPLLHKTGIRKIFTTGSEAYKLYTKLCQPVTGVEATALPSTSAANARMSLEELIRAYSAIRPYLR